MQYQAGIDLLEKSPFMDALCWAYPSALEPDNIPRIAAIKRGFDKMGS